MNSLNIRFEAHGHTLRERELCQRLQQKVYKLLLDEFTVKEGHPVVIQLNGFYYREGQGELYQVLVSTELKGGGGVMEKRDLANEWPGDIVIPIPPRLNVNDFVESPDDIPKTIEIKYKVLRKRHNDGKDVAREIRRQIDNLEFRKFKPKYVILGFLSYEALLSYEAQYGGFRWLDKYLEVDIVVDSSTPWKTQVVQEPREEVLYGKEE